MRSLLSKISSALLGSIFIGICAYIPAANAAEQISFRVSGFERSLAVADLRKLIDVGEQSDVLSGLLSVAGVDPNRVRGYLGMSIDLKQFDLDVSLVDKFLNSYLIDLLLLDLGKFLHPPGVIDSNSAGAIKAAVIASLADDNKISIIEFLEKYPTEIVVEVDTLSKIQERLNRDYANLAEPFAKLIQRLPRR